MENICFLRIRYTSHKSQYGFGFRLLRKTKKLRTHRLIRGNGVPAIASIFCLTVLHFTMKPKSEFIFHITHKDVSPQIRIGTCCAMFPPKGKKGEYHSQMNEDFCAHTHFFKQNGTHLANGTFLEIGALDGVFLSNTIFFEQSASRFLQKWLKS